MISSSPILPTKPPYVRLSVFYFTYFAALGVFVPYWTVYLKKVAGFSAAQIGELMAVFMASKVVAPFIWGWLADHTGQRLRIIRLASALAVVPPANEGVFAHCGSPAVLNRKSVGKYSFVFVAYLSGADGGLLV